MNAPLLTLLAAASPALAQGTMTYSWDVNGTGSDTAVLMPGESARLILYATWDPYDDITGFAGTIYDILGVEGWTTGEVVSFSRNFQYLPIHEPPDENNNWHFIEAFQLPPAFNPDFDAGRPVWLFDITWQPDNYTPRTVRVTDANHLNNDLYTDDFGTSVSYDQAPSDGATIHVIPAPATATLLALALMRLRR
jgi:hypothetical protein